MRKLLALLRVSWLTALSYRVNMFFSILSLLGTIIPIYYVTQGLQGMMAAKLTGQGGQYLAFVLAGTLGLYVLSPAVTALSSSLASGAQTGTLEALLSTPTRASTIAAGLSTYQVIWAVMRVIVVLVAAVILGARISWTHLPQGIALLLLIFLAYLPIGILAGAMQLAFRTTGPLPTATIVLSTLLGGVYYPTSSLPSFVQPFAALVPLTPGLRAFRHVLLDGGTLASVAPDALALLAVTVVLTGASVVAFSASLRHARRAGTLAQY